MPEPILVSGAVAVLGNIVQVVWGDEEGRPNYDVFVSFNEESYVYHGTTPTHQYSFLTEYDAISVQVAIQIESTNKERSSFLTIFESDIEDLVQLS
jgi:hypothetical protein